MAVTLTKETTRAAVQVAGPGPRGKPGGDGPCSPHCVSVPRLLSLSRLWRHRL